jgi:hypothetical protein
MSKYGKQEKLFENWRRYLREQEEGEPQTSSWPGEPPKIIQITASSKLSPQLIIKTWKKLASMSPPNNAEEQLANIGGFESLVANVKALEKNFAAAAGNPARIHMPVVEPDKGDIENLGQRLKKGDLDFKAPFAPDKHTEPVDADFPRGLNKHPEQIRDKWLTKGQRDGDLKDDSAVKLNKVPIQVAASYPTQKQVYLDKSLWNILNFGGTQKGGTAYGPATAIAIQDGDKNFILDGHHRWSSAFISGGPQAKMKVQGLTGLDSDTAIAALRSYGNARGNKQKD